MPAPPLLSRTGGSRRRRGMFGVAAVAMAAAILGSSCASRAPQGPAVTTQPIAAASEARTLLDDTRALARLPRSAEAIAVVRSPQWVSDAVGWHLVGRRVLLRLGIEQAPARDGVDLSAAEGWETAGIDLDAPVTFALLDARTDTFAFIVGVRDDERVLGMIEAAGRSLDRRWERADHGEAVIVRDLADDRFGIVVHDGLAALVIGGGAVAAIERMVVETPAGSLSESPGLVQSSSALSEGDDVIFWADLAGLASDWGSKRAGPRHPLVGALGAAIVGLRLAGRDITVSGALDLEEGSLARRLLDTEPTHRERIAALARSPIGVAAHLAPDSLSELAAALWMFSARPEAAEAASEVELGGDVQADLLPHLDGRVALFARSNPPVGSALGSARWAGEAWWGVRDRSSGDALARLLARAPVFSEGDSDRLFISDRDEGLLVSTTDPTGAAPPWATGAAGDELESRVGAFLEARADRPLCAVADVATLGYLDAPYHYASLDDLPEPPPQKPPGAVDALEIKRRELRAIEVEALAEWRQAEELDMKYVLASLDQLGRAAICVSPSRRGVSFEGKLMMRADGLAALFERWLSLRDEQSEAMAETMRRIESLEARRWKLGEALRQLETPPD